jgi:asparagine synthetase B (glutamine-hydrolysing)
MSKYREAAFIPLIVNIENLGMSTEAAEAIDASKQLNIEPYLIQRFGSVDLVKRLKELSCINDQPHADPSGLSYLSIFQEAKALGLKVVLLGHGPDELFWGYPWFNSRLRTARSKLNFQNLSREYWDTPGKSSRLLWSFGQKDGGFDTQFSSDHYLKSTNLWEKSRAEIVHSYLSSNGLRQSDRLAMACGVEPRTPYADSRLYGWAQENSIKSLEAFDKKEFRGAVELGPLEASRNRKKEGFQSPMGTWFQDSQINDFVGDCLEIISKKGVDWRIKPKLKLLSPSEKYRIIMLGSWLTQFS